MDPASKRVKVLPETEKDAGSLNALIQGPK